MLRIDVVLSIDLGEDHLHHSQSFLHGDQVHHRVASSVLYQQEVPLQFFLIFMVPHHTAKQLGVRLNRRTTSLDQV